MPCGRCSGGRFGNRGWDEWECAGCADRWRFSGCVEECGALAKASAEEDESQQDGYGGAGDAPECALLLENLYAGRRRGEEGGGGNQEVEQFDAGGTLHSDPAGAVEVLIELYDWGEERAHG